MVNGLHHQFQQVFKMTLPYQWGKTKRYHLIQKFINVNQYQSYLEIGISRGDCWRNIQCEKKVGIDPHPQLDDIIKINSDDFFKNNTARFDIIFIDGNHIYSQVVKDINNSWKVLNIGGVIILHDMIPINAIQASNPKIKGDPSWCGDIFKANWDLLSHDYEIASIDHGCGIIRSLNYSILEQNKDKTFQEFCNSINNFKIHSYDSINFKIK